MHGRPKVLILVVDIDTPVNEDFCNEDIVVPSTLKDRKETRAVINDASITDSWNMTGEAPNVFSISRETKGKGQTSDCWGQLGSRFWDEKSKQG